MVKFVFFWFKNILQSATINFKKETDNNLLNERWYTHQTSSMGAAILENMPVTRSEDSTLFREISREIFAVRVGRTATCVGFREISREMLWPNAR